MSANLRVQKSWNSGRVSSRSMTRRGGRPARVGQERLDLLGRRQDADRVQVDAADELLVGAGLGGADPHPVQLGEDGPVDHVVLRDLGDLEAGDLDQVGQADVGDQVEVVGDDGHLAALLEVDEAVGVDLGDLGARRVVVADRGDVAGRCRRPCGPGRRPAASSPGRSGRGPGQDLELDGGRGVGVVLRPLGDPVVEELEGLGVPGEPQAPLVGDLAQRLAEDQAGVGGERVDPPAAGLAAEGQDSPGRAGSRGG